MRHVALRVLTILSLAGAAWLAVLLVGRNSALNAERVTTAMLKEQNAAIVEAAYRENRALIVKSAREVAEARTAERKVRARLDATTGRMESTLDSARAVLADSLATAEALRTSLTTTVAKVDTLLVEVSRYKTAADSLAMVYSAERAVLLSTLSKADEVIVEKNLALGAWKEAARPLPWYKRAAKSLCVGGVSAGGAGAGAAIGDVQGAAVGALVGVIIGSVSCK